MSGKPLQNIGQVVEQGVKGVIQRRKCQNNHMHSFIILKKHFDDVEMETPLLGTRMVLDIYISSIKLVIEYDGGLHHKDYKRDIKKRHCVTRKKCHIQSSLEFREPECPTYNSPNPNTFFL
ncbi:hypothetical protein RCO48_09255 [Peribacillus frigoritolerans]|nr:hypothetical protein [Peribacillus frigoritolerans]